MYTVQLAVKRLATASMCTTPVIRIVLNDIVIVTVVDWRLSQNSLLYVLRCIYSADMRLDRLKSYRKMMGIVIVLCTCIIISKITNRTDQWRLSTYLRRKIAFPHSSSSRHITSSLTTQQTDNTHVMSSTLLAHFNDFIQALTARADADRYIMLVMCDESYIDMAINFYEASLRAHHVDNFLFVGVGRNTCYHLTRFLIPCFYYTNDPTQDKASYYGQTEFIRKMNIRTDMVLDALAANFTVIHSDTDVAFFANPVQQLKVSCNYQRLSCSVSQKHVTTVRLRQ